LSTVPRKAVLLVCFCAIVFAVGLAWLFWLRFQAGDLYPAYSSLRGDPLGTQVFFESLQKVGTGGAQRNFRPLDQVAMDAATTLLVCGVTDRDRFFDDEAWPRLLEKISTQGGRLVVAFKPSKKSSGVRRDAEPDAAEEEGDAAEAAAAEEEGDAADEAPAGQSPDPQAADDNASTSAKDAVEEEAPEKDDTEWPGLLEHLGVALESAMDEEYDDFALRSIDMSGPLPEMIPWRSPLYFDLQDPEWEVIYWWQDEPALVQRTWGQGTVVLATDSYLFSNEALRGERTTALLAWLVQPPNALTVDEFHHGLVKQPGIANLLRKYRLQGLVASVLILVLLSIWRQAALFVPGPAAEGRDPEEVAVGRGAEEGWVGLMQQHIRPEDLLGVCHATWRTSAAIQRVPDARVAQLARLMAADPADARRKNPVAVYRHICELLKQGKHS
jgi:hypothetical protein